MIILCCLIISNNFKLVHVLVYMILVLLQVLICILTIDLGQLYKSNQIYFQTDTLGTNCFFKEIKLHFKLFLMSIAFSSDISTQFSSKSKK